MLFCRRDATTCDAARNFLNLNFSTFTVVRAWPKAAILRLGLVNCVATKVAAIAIADLFYRVQECHGCCERFNAGRLSCAAAVCRNAHYDSAFAVAFYDACAPRCLKLDCVLSTAQSSPKSHKPRIRKRRAKLATLPATAALKQVPPSRPETLYPSSVACVETAGAAPAVLLKSSSEATQLDLQRFARAASSDLSAADLLRFLPTVANLLIHISFTLRFACLVVHCTRYVYSLCRVHSSRRVTRCNSVA